MIALLAIIVGNYQDFLELGPNEWGDFLAGTIGPLALFWVVLSFFLQGAELRNSVQALSLQTEELKNSVVQQTELVRVSQEHLELEVEKRLRELQVAEDERLAAEKLALESAAPKFSLEAKGGRGNAGLYDTDFILKNNGADATRVELTLEGNVADTQIHYPPNIATNIHKGKELKVIIRGPSRERPYNGLVLVLRSEAFGKVVRVQKFTATEGQFIPTFSEVYKEET